MDKTGYPAIKTGRPPGILRPIRGAAQGGALWKIRKDHSSHRVGLISPPNPLTARFLIPIVDVALILAWHCRFHWPSIPVRDIDRSRVFHDRFHWPSIAALSWSILLLSSAPAARRCSRSSADTCCSKSFFAAV